jgi:hypothetical protein
VLIFLVVFNNTTCFDLAEVFTFANEMRAVEALGANAAQVMTVAAPARGIALVGALVVWILLGRRPQKPARRANYTCGLAGAITVGVWLVSVVVPMFLFVMLASNHGAAAITEFSVCTGEHGEHSVAGDGQC